MTIEKSHFFILCNVSVCIKTTSGFGISLSEQDFIADSRVPGRLDFEIKATFIFPKID